MDKIIINESDMNFGPYDKDDLFQIEKSNVYTKDLAKNRVSVTEFILLCDKKLLFVEAKKTTPNFENCSESQEKLKKYQDYVYSIRDKFVHSVSTYMSMRLGRSDVSELSEKMIQEDIKSLRIVLVLVVKNSYPSSLIHYKEKLDSILKPEKSIWKINDVIVISEAMAKKKGLVTE